MRKTGEKLLENGTSRRSAARRAAAERSRRHRAGRRENGIPTVRDAQRALSESVTFAMQVGRRVEGTQFLDARLLRDATLVILVRSGFALGPAARAVARMLRPRLEHRHVNYVPSINGGEGVAELFPPRGRMTGWTETELKVIERVMAVGVEPQRRRSAITQPKLAE